MKKVFTIFVAVLLTASAFAQSPEKMSYQAVIRDVSDQLVINQDMGMQISILQGSASGTAVYVETQSPTSNANGLVSLEIGTGILVSGDFATIDWANDIYFIKTETDPTVAGGTTYTITGTSQLLSVPYALHAKTANNITGTISETDPVFVASPANGITSTDITNWDNKLDTEVDGDITNEIQDLQLVGNILTITNNGTATDIDLSAYLDNTDTQLTEAEVDGYVSNNGYSTTDTTLNEAEVDAFVSNNGYLTAEVDGNATNEIQDLQLVGNILTITNNGTATDIDLSAYLDNTDTQLTEAEVDGYVSNNGYSTTDTTLNEAEVDAFVSNNGYLTAEVDGNATNEIQDLQLVGNILTITNNGTATDIDLSAYLDNTDTQLTEAEVDGYVSNNGYSTTDTTLNEAEVDAFVSNNGYLTAEVDGDATNEIQDLSSLATKTALGDSTAQVRSEIPDVSGFLTSETDPVYTGSQASAINGTVSGQMLYWNGTAWVTVATGLNGQLLKYKNGVPTWTDGNINDLSIGESYQGGIIAYFLISEDPGYDANVRHGLIAAPSDQSTSAEWGCYGATSGADGFAIGTGNQNTIDIMAGCLTAGIAARLCGDLVLGGYSDWYLPSKDELNKLYAMKMLGFGGFANSNYWSSTEYNNLTAWRQYFGDGYQSYNTKGNTFYVRAIRAF